MRIARGWLLCALIGGVLGGCKDREPGASTKRVDDIQEAPLRYLGRSVTVIGRVDEVFGDRAFELEGGGVIWPSELLVVTAAPVRFGPTKLQEDEELVVRGIVHRMAPGELDRALGRSVDRELVRRYRDQAVLVADSVQLIETQVRWSKPYQQGAVVSAIRLFSAIDPSTFSGHAIDLANVPVRATTGRGLWVGFGPRSELFLVPLHEEQLTSVQAGDHVAIRGTVREVPVRAEAAGQPALDPALERGEKVYIEASELTKLARRPST